MNPEKATTPVLSLLAAALLAPPALAGWRGEFARASSGLLWGGDAVAMLAIYLGTLLSVHAGESPARRRLRQLPLALAALGAGGLTAWLARGAERPSLYAAAALPVVGFALGLLSTREF